MRMILKKEVEFNTIVNDILKDEYFINLKYEIHHGISRMEHSIHVAKLSYLLCKFFHVKKMEQTTRAALLHDYFKTEEIKKNAFVNHPMKAAENAARVYHISDFERNIIESHMFPVVKVMPRSKESFIVSMADKMIAVYECLRYKVPLVMGSSFLYFLNFMIIPR